MNVKDISTYVTSFGTLPRHLFKICIYVSNVCEIRNLHRIPHNSLALSKISNMFSLLTIGILTIDLYTNCQVHICFIDSEIQIKYNIYYALIRKT